MIKICIPNNNFEERKYIIDFFFDTFLGIPYELIINDSQSDYLISYQDCTIIIRDHFWGKYEQVNSYLTMEALPKDITYVQNFFLSEKNIPVLYGNSELLVSEKNIVCGIDLFASSFFMLVRWEEYVNQVKDLHDRFPGIESVACKFNFLHRPIVNEYGEMLWRMLVYIGVKEKRKKKNFNLKLTHDIDFLQYPIRKNIRILVGDILKRKQWDIAWYRVKNLIGNDPFDCYDWLMDLSERAGVQSHFYFMSCFQNSPLKDTEFYLKKKKYKEVIAQIKNRKHIIGFHPGYYTYNNYNLWKEEKNVLEHFSNLEVKEGRQHYLRMNIPLTMKIWSENNMCIDSSFGYADYEGFRCGTGDMFPVFDFLLRKSLRLYECPLIVMDGTLCGYRKYSIEKSYEVISYYFRISQKYNSTLTLLFHNTSFDNTDWYGWDELYKQVLKIK